MPNTFLEMSRHVVALCRALGLREVGIHGGVQIVKVLPEPEEMKLLAQRNK
jgi:hypothetical protein